MKINLSSQSDLYSGKFGFIAQTVVMTLAIILAAYILPGVHINSVGAAIITAIVIALLNSFIRPILIVITLPFTVLTMGLFLLIINAVIILLASGLVSSFHVDGFWNALLFSLLLTLLNYLLEIPNRITRRPSYQHPDSEQPALHVDTDEEGFSPYEVIEDEEESNNNQ